MMDSTETTADFPGGIPERIGPCRLVRFLGRGGMGIVFLAELTEDRPYAAAATSVAVKVVRPELVKNLQRLERFRREASLGIRIVHPAVVRTYEVDSATVNAVTYQFMVMEYVEGRTLGSLVREMRVIPEALLRQIGAQVAHGLGAIHEVNAVHRDMKPDNILITPDHQVKLMDLGVAFIAEEMQLTVTGAFLGTLRYAAPEQFGAGTIGPATDLYSVGVSLYEAATGLIPFDAGTLSEVIERHLHFVPPKAGQRNPQLTPFFEEVLAQLLEKKPEHRFPSAGMLAEVLEQGESSDWWRQRERTVRAARPTGRLRRIQVARRTKLIGRDSEMNQLWTLYLDAKAGAGKLLLMEGEAGVGKTRLVDELLGKLETEDAHVLYASHHPGALSRSVVDHFGEASLEGALASYLPVHRRLVPGFAALLTGAPPPQDSGTLSAEAVHAVFCQLVRSLAAERPVVWIVEDLHLASASERSLLLSVARICYDLRVLLVATSRPGVPSDEMASFERLEVTRRLALPRLPREAASRLVLENFQTKVMPLDLASRIASVSDGNPFFVVEILKELREKGLLEELPNGTYAARRRVDTIALPSSVRELLRARLDVLSPDDRALLEVGAVQGFTFDPDLTARVLERKRLEVLQRLAEIERHHSLVRATGAGFEFDQHPLQELIYGSLAPLLRSEYHGLLAAAFEQRSGLANQAPAEMPGEAAVFLSQQYLKGGRREGLRMLDRALDHLGFRYDNEALLDLADLALALLGNEDPARRCDIRLRQVDGLAWLGRREAQRAAVEDALAAAEASGDEARIVRARSALGGTLVNAGQYATAREVLEDALRRAQSVPAAEERAPEAEVLGKLGLLCILTGQFEQAREYFGRLLELARQVGDRRLEAKALADLGLTLSVADHEQARKYLDEHLAIAHKIGFRYPDALYSLGLSFLGLGKYAECHKYLEQYVAQCRETGGRHGEALGHLLLAHLTRDEGQIEEAARQLDMGLEIARAIEGSHLRGFALIYQGDVARARGEPERARDLYEEAVELCRGLGASQALALAALCLGRLLLAEGERERARALFTETVDLAKKFSWEAYTYGYDAAAYLALLGDVDPASLAVPDYAPVYVRAEAHLVLYWAGAGDIHLEKARAALNQMCAHLSGAAREQFWQYSPTARLLEKGRPGGI